MNPILKPWKPIIEPSKTKKRRVPSPDILRAIEEQLAVEAYAKKIIAERLREEAKIIQSPCLKDLNMKQKS
jgi:hypothetical protein